MFTGIRDVRRRSLAMASITALVIGCMGISAAAAAAGTSETAASPTAQQITIPGWLNPGQPVVDQDGDLWLTAQRDVSSRGLQTELLEVTTAGRVIRTFDRNVTPLLIGPDGGLWFATTGPQVRLGSITPGGRVRVFDPFSKLKKSSEHPQVNLDGATVGPNGDVWFVVDSNYEGQSEVGYISPAGRITVVPIPNNGYGWFGIATDSNGYIWLSGLNLLTWLSPTGETGTLKGGDPQGPLIPDLTGDVWAPEGYGAEFDEVRSEPPGRPETVRGVTWTSTNLGGPGYSPPVGLATAADGQMWFLGELCTSITAIRDNCGSYGDPELGSISSLGAITTYPSPVPTESNTPQLTAGPDGRLWTTNDGELWAITLPGAPSMRAPSLRLLSAASHARSTVITFRCSGQPGRYCFGTITVRAGESKQQTQTYAIDPDHTTTYTIASAEHRPGTRISVKATGTLSDGHTIQHLSATIRTVK